MLAIRPPLLRQGHPCARLKCGLRCILSARRYGRVADKKEEAKQGGGFSFCCGARNNKVKVKQSDGSVQPLKPAKPRLGLHGAHALTLLVRNRIKCHRRTLEQPGDTSRRRGERAAEI